ncbi:Major facilitator superfamily domain, general substrate transporter [Diplocarpon rosae]|nr:Major facilitator superfamily domain, general substrate transporter [Diplocarpon rosae]
MDQEAASQRKPRYKGEDISPTTARELRGFYAYGLAAEVFAVCGVGSFLPVTLEQLARERGVLRFDKITPCVVQDTSDQVSANMTRVLMRAAGSKVKQCVIPSLGNITTSSFAMYTFSVAVFVQALALVSFSAAADHGELFLADVMKWLIVVGSYRKKFLMAFGFCGSISCILFILVDPKVFLVAPLLIVIGVTCLGSSFVVLNSFLPLLVANYPEVEGLDDIAAEHASSIPPPYSPIPNERASEGLHPTRELKEGKVDSTALRLSTHISSTGVGIGYIAAVSVQILSILLLYGMSKISVSSTLPLRLVLLMVGMWWMVFTIPSAIWLRDRPGPPLKSISSRNSCRACLGYISFAWASVIRTLKIAIKLRQTVIFLVGWFLLSDAVATVSGTAILFARTELKMGTVEIALLSITATSSGIAGAFIWPLISRRFELKASRAIVACIGLMEIIPLYGLLGYIPLVKAWGVGGLQQSWEIYPLGFVHGFVMGGLSSYCRSLFGQLIPPGSEAAFYALYAITDKGSSAIGPAIVGTIVDATGSIRPAFIFLAVLIAFPMPLMAIVNAEMGRADAARMAGILKSTKVRDESFEEQSDTELEETERLMRDHE